MSAPIAPLAPDVEYVLGLLRQQPALRGIPVDRLGPVAFGLALDSRIIVRLSTL